MYWFVAVSISAACADILDGDVIEYLYSYRRNVPTEPYYNESFFGSLENYDLNATETTEKKYPWIASVMHSRIRGHPYICTAACIEDRIFVTAGRCLYSLKVAYTTVLYQETHLPVIAFVVPSKKSKQGFDDIGFIVVADDVFQDRWITAKLFDTTNRTDDNFDWFANLNLPENSLDFVVVGYATHKDLKNVYLAQRTQYKLKELDVIANINICPEILIYNKLIRGFHVPCYHSCTVEQFEHKDSRCFNYHGVIGAAVFHVPSNKLWGIATWGSTFNKYPLPVGFSVLNSNNFFEDYTCARRIKLDKGSLVINGYYQALCEDIN